MNVRSNNINFKGVYVPNSAGKWVDIRGNKTLSENEIKFDFENSADKGKIQALKVKAGETHVKTGLPGNTYVKASSIGDIPIVLTGEHSDYFNKAKNFNEQTIAISDLCSNLYKFIKGIKIEKIDLNKMRILI